jgi:phenylpropionate dioxygenase-like ring-hydroxylating dioxygenase large terminal subunit
MRRLIRFAQWSILLSSLVIGSLPASAHHSLSIYDRGQSKTVEGVVKEFRFANPHARILLVVAVQDGTMKEWDFEGGGVRRLTERGISVNTIAKGDKITVSYNPMRDGSARGLFVGFTTPDGKKYVTRR